MIRSIAAVVVGYIGWTAIWLGGNAGLQAALPDQLPTEGPVESSSALLIVLGLSVLCSLASGVIAKVIRPESSTPVLTLAVLLLATGIAVQAGFWDRMPLWYHLTFLVLLVPVCLVGARLVGNNAAPQNA